MSEPTIETFPSPTSDQKKCTKCKRIIPSDSLGLSHCLPCTMTELNRFMTSPRSVVEQNIESLSDCSIETLHSYWSSLTEFNTRIKMFHDTMIKAEIKQGNIVKSAQDFENVVKIREHKTKQKEQKVKRVATQAQKNDAKVVKVFLKLKPTANSETILKMMGPAFAEEWSQERVADAMEFAAEMIRENK